MSVNAWRSWAGVKLMLGVGGGDGDGDGTLVDGGVSSSDSWVVLQEVEGGGGSWEVDATFERLGGGGDSLLLCFSFLACCH